MKNVVRARVEIGDDRILHVRLPEGTPSGTLDVLIVYEGTEETRTRGQRSAAARAGRGALAHLDVSSAEFLAERLDDERRRERALGS